MPYTLLNTRPAHQARVLTEAAQALGYVVIECPALHIHCQPFRQPDAQVWIFTSANAVRCYLAQQKQLPAGQLIAIGPQTAEALHQASQKGSPPFFSLPKNFDSENVLKMPVFAPENAKSGQKVAIVKGKGGRNVLKVSLQTQGWAVDEVIVYRREACGLCPLWSQFRRAKQPLVLAMSVESVEALLARLDAADRAWLMAQPLACLSVRIAETLRNMGWQGQCHIAPSSDRAGMINLLQTLSDQNETRTYRD